MKGQVASALIVVALVVGSGIGYFANTNSNHATTETVVTTYTVTLPQGSGLLRCVVTEYSVWLVGYGNGGVASSYSTTTQQAPVQTYTNTTTVTQTVGFTTISTSAYTGTVTGAIAQGNYTTCTYIAG